MPDDSVTRYELDAKTQAIEARMDARLAHMDSIIGSAMDIAKEAKEEAKETRRHVTIVSWTVAGVIIAGVAMVIGVATAWQTSAYQTLDAHIQQLSQRMYHQASEVEPKKK